MIAMINITRAIILTIIIIIIIITISYEEESFIFVAKKVITLINIETINNKKQKNFGNNTKNYTEIKANTTYYWLVIKKIQMMILMMTIIKLII